MFILIFEGIFLQNNQTAPRPHPRRVVGFPGRARVSARRRGRAPFPAAPRPVRDWELISGAARPDPGSDPGGGRVGARRSSGRKCRATRVGDPGAASCRPHFRVRRGGEGDRLYGGPGPKF